MSGENGVNGTNNMNGMNGTNGVAGPTKICKHCQSAMPKKAKVCATCGRKQGGKLKWIIIGIIVVIFIAAIAGSGDDDSKKNGKKVGTVEGTDNKDGSNKDSDSKEPEKDGFDVGDIVETKTLRISFISAEDYISDNQFMQPAEGNKYVKSTFEFENIGKDDEYVSSMDFDCYADGYDCESHYFDSNLGADLSPGRKTQIEVVFEIPENSTEVCLEYETNMWSGDKVKFYISR